MRIIHFSRSGPIINVRFSDGYNVRAVIERIRTAPLPEPYKQLILGKLNRHARPNRFIWRELNMST